MMRHPMRDVIRKRATLPRSDLNWPPTADVVVWDAVTQHPALDVNSESHQ